MPLNCPSGTYLETIGNDALSDCVTCDEGKYSVIHGSSTCLNCPSGTYLEKIINDALSDCTACPSNSNTPAGSAALANCTCNAGWTAPATTAMTCSGGCLCQPSTGTFSGEISDGTSNNASYANCYWLIASSGLISLSFSSFSTESCCDFVTINRCNSSSSCVEQASRLSGSSVSLGNIYTSSTGYMQVMFTSDGSVASSGFVVSWSSRSNSSTCIVCVAGRYKASTGSAACTACGAGTYSTAVGAAASAPASQGFLGPIEARAQHARQVGIRC